MALESVSVAETLIQSNTDDNDLEDGEIPSDEDDEPVAIEPPKPVVQELPMPPPPKTDNSKNKTHENKYGKNKKNPVTPDSKGNKHTKNPASEDWAGDVEKAIRAALDEDRMKNHENKTRSKNNKNRNRKRNRDEKEDERVRDKKRRVSDEENLNDDDDEMLFIRGASPMRKGSNERSPPRRIINDHDNYDSGSDYDDRPSNIRHREDNKRGRGGRRGGKNDRGGKNKNRNQLRRDERNTRRNNNQSNDHNQDPDAICLYYMQGKCHRGDDCPFSHNALPPRKMELCKFYLMDCCAKRDKCLYMHHDFPCKFFHTGLKCTQGDNCKFSHQPMSEQVKNILLKHLETAPKEILGNFPRLSREGAILMISNTEKFGSNQNIDPNQKIPSLFEVKVPTPGNSGNEEHAMTDDELTSMAPYAVTMDEALSKVSTSSPSTTKERKASGKKTRWGSDEDRVPYEQIMLLQSANQFGQLSNAALDLAVQEQIQLPSQPPVAMDFYNETAASNSTAPEVSKPTEPFSGTLPKDVDLRQMLSSSTKPPPVVSLADQAANLTKMDDESDHDEESDLVIEVPGEEEDHDKEKENKTDDNASQLDKLKQDVTPSVTPEIPANLPKKAQELFMRVQQHQREAKDSFKNIEDDSESKDIGVSQEDWYSDDDNDDDDDDDDGNLTIVLRDIQKDVEADEPKPEPKVEVPSSIPQPAAIVDKLGDLSKIDISMEVSKLLSSIKARSTLAQSAKDSSKPEEYLKTENGGSSPKLSPSSMQASTSVSRDPRMSRDPRQRREERKPSTSKPEVKELRNYKLETSIYSSGIILMDNLDTDLRAKMDEDLRRKDMDLRCFQGSGFGDTDLRVADVDLRQMMGLPFKPAPSHVPCTEIDGSFASHPPIVYKVYTVDVPRPNYTGLKLTKNDPQVKYDPRLRKIFRLSKTDLADSPMSPPPMKVPETPKSPPLIRTDPRRKALEAVPQQIPTQPMQQDMGPQYMPVMQSMPPQMMMGQMMPGQMAPSMNPMAMGPPAGPPNQGQMNYDPRYAHRNNGIGILGPGPQPVGYGSENRQPFEGPYDGPNYDGGNYDGGNYEGGNYDGNYDGGNYDGNYDGGNYDGPSYQSNFNNFGPKSQKFGPNGSSDGQKYSAQDWTPNPNPNRQHNNRKERRRTNRGKYNGGRKKDSL